MAFLLERQEAEDAARAPPPQPQPQAQAQAPAPGAGGAGGAAWAATMLGPQLVTKGGLKPTAEALGDAPVVLLYFSAHWCPPCKQFTPMLAQAYNRQQGLACQVVFVSSDRDQGSWQSYYNEMPW